MYTRVDSSVHLLSAAVSQEKKMVVFIECKVLQENAVIEHRRFSILKNQVKTFREGAVA